MSLREEPEQYASAVSLRKPCPVDGSAARSWAKGGDETYPSTDVKSTSRLLALEVDKGYGTWVGVGDSVVQHLSGAKEAKNASIAQNKVNR